MHVSALLRSAPVRALAIRTRRLARRALAPMGRWTRKPLASDPIRTFSVPSGFSASRPPLMIALTATALIACTTAVLGTFLAGTPEAPPVLPVEDLPTVEAIHGSAQLSIPPEAPSSAAPPAAPLRPPLPAPERRSADPAESPIQIVEAPPADPVPEQRSLDSAENGAGSPPAIVESPPAVAASDPRSADPAETGSGSTTKAREGSSATTLAQGRPAMPAEGPYAGVWATDEKACSPQLKRDGLIPALISSEGAWAGGTTCSFKSSKRVGNTWTFGAICSDTRRQWKTTIRMSLAGNRLTWASQRGTQTYVRCHAGLLHAHSPARPNSPV